MTRARDVANVLTAANLLATDTEVSAVSAQIPANVAGKNFVINGDMEIWQRGTSFATNSGNFYTADRWACGNNPNSTVSRQSTSLPGFRYYLRNARNSGSTNTTNLNMVQSFETANVIALQGKEVTLSFYARAGANFSGLGNVINVNLAQGTGTDQNLWTGLTNQSNIIASTATLTTTFQRFTYTATIGTNATSLSMNLYYAPTGTAGTNDLYDVTGVQLEIGSTATPFSRAGGDIAGELAKCQRYYQGYRYFHALKSSNNYARMTFNYMTTMRATPTIAYKDSSANVSRITTYSGTDVATANRSPLQVIGTDTNTFLILPNNTDSDPSFFINIEASSEL